MFLFNVNYKQVYNQIYGEYTRQLWKIRKYQGKKSERETGVRACHLGGSGFGTCSYVRVIYM